MCPGDTRHHFKLGFSMKSSNDFQGWPNDLGHLHLEISLLSTRCTFLDTSTSNVATGTVSTVRLKVAWSIGQAPTLHRPELRSGKRSTVGQVDSRSPKTGQVEMLSAQDACYRSIWANIKFGQFIIVHLIPPFFKISPVLMWPVFSHSTVFQNLSCFDVTCVFSFHRFSRSLLFWRDLCWHRRGLPAQWSASRQLSSGGGIQQRHGKSAHGGPQLDRTAPTGKKHVQWGQKITCYYMLWCPPVICIFWDYIMKWGKYMKVQYLEMGAIDGFPILLFLKRDVDMGHKIRSLHTMYMHMMYTMYTMYILYKMDISI